MCSIYGIVGLGEVAEGFDSLFVDFNQQLTKRRGPDDSNRFFGNGFCLGFNRLQFKGSSQSGLQPVQSSCGRYLVLLNGEIYNYLELARSLKAHRISRLDLVSDTMVCAEFVAENGWEQLLNSAEGMFSIVIIDQANERLVISRDSCGHKPLFYCQNAERVFFSSDSRGLAFLGGHFGELCPLGVRQFLSFGHNGPYRTVFKNIRQVLPGSFETFNFSRGFEKLEGRDIGFIDRYWSLGLVRDVKLEFGSQRNLANYASGLIDTAVLSQIENNQRPAVLFSGGIDSTLIAESLKRQNIDFTAFTFGFDGHDFDESKKAQQVAKRLGIETIVVECRDSYSQSLALDLISNMPAPLGDTSCLAANLLSSHVSDTGYRYGLTGDGGDELFSGYKRHEIYYLVMKIWQYLPQSVKPIALRLLSTVNSTHVTRRLINRIITGMLGRSNFLAYRSKSFSWVLNEDSSCLFFNLYLMIMMLEDSVIDRSDFLSFYETPIPLRMNQELWPYIFDRLIYLPCDIMAKSDICGMAHSLEYRAPLLDSRIIDLASSDAVVKTSRHGDKTVLKSVFCEKVGEDLLAEKQGFTIPLKSWIGQDLAGFCGEGIENLRDLATDEGIFGVHWSQDGISVPLQWNMAVLGQWLESY